MALDGTSGRHRVFLMRHGEVSYFDQDGRPVNPKHVALTERGREQSKAAAAALADVAFDRAVCSGLPRARQTAEIVLAGRDLAIESTTSSISIQPAATSFTSWPVGSRKKQR